MRAAAEACAPRMRAWRAHAYGAPGELRLETARVPVLRAPDHVLVRVHAASLNPLDVAMVGGYGARLLNILRSMEGTDVEFPLVLGRDFCGEVVAAGAAARLRPGRRVWGVVPPHWAGAHAQYVLVRDRWAGAAPAALADAAAGGALYAALSACAALRAAGVPPAPPPAARARRAPSVLLLGLGGVGHAALQLLLYSGARVVVGCSGELCARAAALGATAFDRHHADYERDVRDAGPYDAVVDCAGLGSRAAGSLPWRFGRYVTLTSPLLRLADEGGAAAGSLRAAVQLLQDNAAVPPPPDHTEFAACPPRVRWAFFRPSSGDIELLRRLAEAGKLEVAVERVFPWWAADAAYGRAAQGGARGKLVLDFTAAQPEPHPAPDALA